MLQATCFMIFSIIYLMLKSKHLLLFLILILALSLRLYGINWDQGFHLHPDERMLIMVSERIHFFDKLNPDFFNYGSLPIYLLKGFAQISDSLFLTNFANYQGILIFGRTLSVLVDILVIIFIYKMTCLLYKKEKIALLASLFYALAFFPIQNTHFFVVDVFLNLFVTVLIYQLLLYLKQPTIKRIFLLAVIFAAMMATKFTAIIFLPIIWTVILIKSGRHFKKLIINFLIFNFEFLILNFLFMPYAFLNYHRFINEVSNQLRMNSNPYTFPYTLQYVGTLPYLYYLKNIFLWGLGPIISILSLIGGLKLGKFLISKNVNILCYMLYVICYMWYFLVIGRSAVKFMRYMLPLYPFFCIMAGYGLYQIQKLKVKSQNYNSKVKSNRKTFKFLIVFLTFDFLLLIHLWTLMFINIYSQPHTRIAATNWILRNIPAGATIATEHWDDGMPLTGGENYKREELTLYDQPDDDRKWLILNDKLKRTDYIIIASNRLYIPLQKLADCTKYKSCYPKTAEYYRKLFAGKLEFKKVAEFAVYPNLCFMFHASCFMLNDQSADESFTVYDHPKILIYKKI